MIRRWVGLARKAWHRPPAAIVHGLRRELRRQAGRPWSHLRPRMFDERALLSTTGAASVDALWDALARQPFFITPAALPAAAAAFRRRYPESVDAVIRQADDAVAHRFELLGSGPMALGASLPWHSDFKAGRQWPLRYSNDLEFEFEEDESDVKVPWELSRCQHFTFLGQAYALTGDERYPREFVAQVDDWIAANPWHQGVNWICAMDVALRAVSWIWGFYYLANSQACADRGFRSRFLRSLFLHGEYLHGNLEHSDVNGNHYLCDGVGLVFLGSFFRSSGPGVDWLNLGRRIVTDEILLQVHDDGVDFEKSIAYHRLVLEGFLTAFLLLQRCGEAVPPRALERLHRMFAFVAAYTGPDGRSPLVGDADDGRIQRLGTQAMTDHRYLLSTGAVMFGDGALAMAAGRFWEESFWLLGPGREPDFEALPLSPTPSTAFPHGGFYVMRHGASHVFIDCGEVGMGGRGGHGHNDILAFELVLDGTRILTDCGAFVYTASRSWRDRFRSTAMHNTVQVDDAEINRFFPNGDLWRLRDDARPVGVVWRPAPGRDYFRGAHNGYDREPHRIRHVREILFDHSRLTLIVRDRLEGAGDHQFTWRFHFVPGTEARLDGSVVRARIEGRDVWLACNELPAGATLRLEPGWVSPQYGVRLESTTLVVACRGLAPVEAWFAVGMGSEAGVAGADVREWFENAK